MNCSLRKRIIKNRGAVDYEYCNNTSRRIKSSICFCCKIKRKKVKVSAKGETITITPVQDVISNARGMFKGSSFGTDTLMKQKQSEKKLEYGE